jgi:NADPH:quinone reductase-like Zn-dependent oxidoreductase
MKAILWAKYGSPDLLEYGEAQKPIPKDNEVLIKVFAGTVTPGDCEIRRFDMHVLFWLPLRIYFGLFKPKRPILGMEVAGEIEAIGKNVTKFKIGDAILGGTGLRFGAHAEYVCLNSTKLITHKPEGLSYDDVVSLPTAGLNGLHYIRKCNIQKGQSILIIGAGGCFGTYAVQLAKYFGATVTAVDSTNKLDTLRSIGVDHVIDFTQEDFAKNGKTYDIIFDIAGKHSITRNIKSLKPKGRYVLATPWLKQVMQGTWINWTTNKKFIYDLAKEDLAALEFLKALMLEGKIKAVIDKRYPLEQTAEAHKYVESGNKTGQVMISVAE